MIEAAAAVAAPAGAHAARVRSIEARNSRAFEAAVACSPTPAAMRGQVITLQVGAYANFTGAHFWNLQDEAAGLAEGGGELGSAFGELDASVLYRLSRSASVRSPRAPRCPLASLTRRPGCHRIHASAPSV